MTFSLESLEKKKEYLTPEFYQRLKTEPQRFDPFSRTDDLPKAFRVGECSVMESGKRVTFDVLLFWKSDTRTEERSIAVEAAKLADGWVINNIN